MPGTSNDRRPEHRTSISGLPLSTFELSSGRKADTCLGDRPPVTVRSRRCPGPKRDGGNQISSSRFNAPIKVFPGLPRVVFSAPDNSSRSSEAEKDNGVLTGRNADRRMKGAASADARDPEAPIPHRRLTIRSSAEGRIRRRTTPSPIDPREPRRRLSRRQFCFGGGCAAGHR